MYDLIYQVNASKKNGVIQGLKDTGNRMAYIFKDFNFPDDVPYGEITGALIWNGRKDVTYEFKDVLLDSVLHTDEGDVTLRDLRPEVFLMRYGTVEADAIYADKNTEYYYYNGRK